MALVFLVIFILVPWQVAFLGSWLIHFYTCASSLADLSSSPSLPPGAEAVPLVTISPEPAETPSEPAELSSDSTQSSSPAPDITPRPSISHQLTLRQQTNARLHLLLFMTWLLPLAAPVLAVWVRTLATAGLTTPFDGDHNFLYVAPFLVLVEVLSGGDASGSIRSFL